MKSQFNVILLDLDGTLIDSQADLATAVNHALKETGQPTRSQEKIIPLVGNGLPILLRKVFGDGQAHLIEKGMEAFITFYGEHCTNETFLYPGVLHGIQHLHQVAKLGIVTNKPHNFSRKIIDHLGLSPYISVLLGGDSLPNKKPHPHPIEDAIRQLNAGEGKALMVGDGIQDITAGKAAHIQTCVARYGYGFNPSLLELNPDFVIDHFSQLTEIAT